MNQKKNGTQKMKKKKNKKAKKVCNSCRLSENMIFKKLVIIILILFSDLHYITRVASEHLLILIYYLLINFH